MSTLIRMLAPGVALACTAAFTLAGCERMAGKGEPAAELAWARAALERNPFLELVASDPQTGLLTVRHRQSGEIEVIKLTELAAAPVSQLEVRQALVAPAPPPSPAPPEPAAPTPAAAPAEPSAATPLEPPAPPVPDTATTGPAVAAATPVTGQYTIERSDGQTRVSGPGVSIVSTGGGTVSGGAEPGQRTVEPIICEGQRLLHLDSRSIYVDGDAITARGGCELHITNSRIVASGTGIVVRDAVVHVSNSHIEGANGSFDAAERSRVFVRGSTFQGVPRRDALAHVQDQGGNRWR